MTLGDVVDELHDEHGLAHTGTAEETDLATLAVGLEQVNHLDTGIEDFCTDGELVKLGSGLVYGAQVLALEVRQTVDGVAEHIEQTALDLSAGRYGDRTLEVVDTCAALETVGALHGHAAHGALSDVLLHFEYQLGAVFTVHLEGRVDGRDDGSVAVTLEDDVDHGADHLGYFTIFFTHRDYG